MRTLIKNVRVILSDEILTNNVVVVNDTKIEYIGIAPNGMKFDKIIDGKGLYLSPGFIDLHIHGGNNADFMDGTLEAFRTVTTYHSNHGITSILATTLSGDHNETLNLLTNFDEYASQIDNCNLLGVHLEGPYFAMSQRGAQDPEYIIPPKEEEYNKFLEFSCVKRWSIAPELPGSLKLGDLLQEKKIIPSIAHTEADYDTVYEARKHGYHLMTHLYSGMQGVHRKGAYRYAGAVEACLLLDEMDAEIIADGKHLPASLLKLIYKCKGKDHIILTSDAMRGAGLKEGEETKLGSLSKGQKVIINDGVAMLHTLDSFAGSVASGDRLVRTMWQQAGVPLVEVIQMITKNPANILGIKNKGQIKENFDADLVFFNENADVQIVMVAGEIKFSNREEEK